MQIELRQVGKRFGRIRALRGVSTEIPSGRALALVGPNGSGKSTLIRVLMGLVSHTGDVRFDERPRDRKTSEQLAYVPQAAPQLAVPVAELVQAVARVRGIEPGDVARLAREFDLDLGAVANQQLRNLSGGTRQKVMVALALAAKTRLLLLDEPTASLDAKSRDRFFALVNERRGSATVILCSHRADELHHLVSHVVALRDGEVAYDGPAAPFLAGRGEAMIELLVTRDAPVQWLARSGFRSEATGYWSKKVTSSEKLALLPALHEKLDGTLCNIEVRDLERLDVRADPEETLDA